MAGCFSLHFHRWSLITREFYKDFSLSRGDPSSHQAILVQWDLEEWHVVTFAGWLFHIFSGLICTPDPALHLLLAHHHQAGLGDLPDYPLHCLAVALPGPWYLQGGVEAGYHLFSAHGGSQQGL